MCVQLIAILVLRMTRDYTTYGNPFITTKFINKYIY